MNTPTNAPMENPIYVISDLHMGAASMSPASAGPDDSRQGRARDVFEFWGHGAHLMGFLDWAEARSGSVLILGDLFEFWQAAVADVLEARRDILDRLAEFGRGDRQRLRYVVGNHDADFKAFISAPRWLGHNFFQHLSPPFRTEVNGQGYYFLHGHEGDPFNRGTFPGRGRALAILAALVKDRVGSPYFDREGRDSVEETLTIMGERVLKFWQWLTGGLALRRGGGAPDLGPVRRGGAGAETAEGGESQALLDLEADFLQKAAEEQLASPDQEDERRRLADLTEEAATAYLRQAWDDFAETRPAECEMADLGLDRGSGRRSSPLIDDHIRQMKLIRQQQPGEPVIIAGHTHFPGRCEQWYYNCGSWTGRHGQVLGLAAGKEPTLFEWRGTDLVEQPWTVIKDPDRR